MRIYDSVITLRGDIFVLEVCAVARLRFPTAACHLPAVEIFNRPRRVPRVEARCEAAQKAGD